MKHPNLINLDVGPLVPKEPEMTVLIPAFGVNDFIRESVESALSQEACDVEVIVVDDGSLPPIKQELTDCILSRIVLATKRNAGISAARNTGIALSSAEYICLLDGDDKIAPNHCSTALDTFRLQPHLDVYVPDATLFGNQDRNGVLPGGQRTGTLLSEFLPRSTPINFEKFLIGESPIIGCSIFRKDSIIEVGGYPEDIRMAEDFYLHAKILLSGAEYSYAKVPTYWYRRHGRAMTTRDSVTLCEWTLEALDRLSRLQSNSIDASAIRRKQRLVSNELFMAQTKEMLNAHRWADAARYLARLDLSAIPLGRQKAKWSFLKMCFTLMSKVSPSNTCDKLH
jgi:glycosyltransferase involved in cell wall biosynthesis